MFKEEVPLGVHVHICRYIYTFYIYIYCVYIYIHISLSLVMGGLGFPGVLKASEPWVMFGCGSLFGSTYGLSWRTPIKARLNGSTFGGSRVELELASRT